ncbi:MAG: phospholipase D-like domain-containing protein [Christensenellaceae bacterium]|jgi:superfamily II DNA or RNA helicase|nr:phospholipase D-like domain-containing protein [Christensenellaceae bacterium]
MPSIIDNSQRIMSESLKNTLNRATSFDVATGFFYFSGFNILAEHLKNIKIRILVGMAIDPNAVTELTNLARTGLVDNLPAFCSRQYSRYNNLQKKEEYINGFVNLFNGSVLSREFDDSKSQETFKMFLKKIKDGTLEIKLSKTPEHSKLYIVTNQYEQSMFGELKGVVFVGSSNFTYSGLVGQGELNNSKFDNDIYDEHMDWFQKKWDDASNIEICTENVKKEFIEEIEKRLCIFSKPSPYDIFIRILHELYGSLDKCDIQNPTKITRNKYADFKYQIDAIKFGIDCINKNSGVIIADVVGLGKSIIASAIAYNLNPTKTIIVTPPHLLEQWNEYSLDFGLRNTRVVSSGKIEDLYKDESYSEKPVLYIIDEAHRYRNESTLSYMLLHQLTRSHPENKIILLTATPYNNKPQDLYALIKLFQSPNRSTINSVDNLNKSFRELIAKYNRHYKLAKKELTDITRCEFENISKQLRMIIEPVTIRRTRIDLSEIKEYAEDLNEQGIKFPTIVGPELMQYELGEMKSLYIDTLTKLSDDFNGARYNPAKYLIDPQKFNKEYGKYFVDTDIQLFQGNMAKLVRRLLVMRFESSKMAFKKTLETLLRASKNMLEWYKKGYIVIMRQGGLPDPNSDDIEEIQEEIDSESEILNLDEIRKNGLKIPNNLFENEYYDALVKDINLLTDIKTNWFDNNNIGDDAKFATVFELIKKLINENKHRKIVIFSSFADTAEYVQTLLVKNKMKSFLYTGASSGKDRRIVVENFDASCTTIRNDYDIIVATDALSEGFNLNRAGVIINYDIPYNPTRVIQRIGRLNRINKKMFNEIFIYNLFPTEIGEEITLTKGISTLKMLLITNIVGNDTKALTQNEQLNSYFKKQFEEAKSHEEGRSWDNEFRNIYYSIKNNKELLQKIQKDIPERTKIVRKKNKHQITVSFAKKGNNYLFASASPHAKKASIVSPEKCLKYFKADKEEESYNSDIEFEKKFEFLRDELEKINPLPKGDRMKGEALSKLGRIKDLCPAAKDYVDAIMEIINTYDDLSDAEIKYIVNLKNISSNMDKVIKEVELKIPKHYLNNIKKKADAIDSQAEIIMFAEDIRNSD